MKNIVLLFLLFTGALVMAQDNYALFAGGCFWCMEPPFETLSGVKNVVSGYANGNGKNPTYKTYGKMGYVEAVRITFDPATISYQQLLDVFWHNIDPTDGDGQFVDRGNEYRPAIFYYDDEQKKLALASKKEIAASGRFSKPLAVEIEKAGMFYPAEEYHQNYAQKNPIRYKWYRARSGRDQFLHNEWNKKIKTQATIDITQSGNVKNFKKPSDEELQKILTPLQYKITQKNGTERAYKNEYWDNEEPGIYVDIISGEPLFSSIDKFKSGTGWPSFTKPLEPENIIKREDRGWFSTRTEVRGKQADSHLGHVFKDGPPPTGLRYCLNSAALRFIHKDDLEKRGYGKYKKLFIKNN